MVILPRNLLLPEKYPKVNKSIGFKCRERVLNICRNMKDCRKP